MVKLWVPTKWRDWNLRITKGYVVDGSEIRLSPVDMVNIPFWTVFYTSQVMQDFFHQLHDFIAFIKMNMLVTSVNDIINDRGHLILSSTYGILWIFHIRNMYAFTPFKQELSILTHTHTRSSAKWSAASSKKNPSSCTTFASENHAEKLRNNEETLSKKFAICLVIPTDIQGPNISWGLVFGPTKKYLKHLVQKKCYPAIPFHNRIIKEYCALLTLDHDQSYHFVRSFHDSSGVL